MARPPPTPSFVWTGVEGGVTALATVQYRGRPALLVGSMRGRVDLYDEETKLLVARILEDPEQRSIVWAGEFGGRILIHVRCAALLRFNEEQTAFEIFSKTAHYGHCASTSSENWLAMPDFEDSTSRIKLWRNPKNDECSQVLSSTGAENWMPICIHLREELKAVFIGWDSGCIDRVDAETSQQLARISLGAEPIFSIVATSRRLFCSTSAPPIRVLDVAEAGLKSCEQQIDYAASANGCSCLSLSPSGKTVYASFWDGTVRAYTTGKHGILFSIQACAYNTVHTICSPRDRQLYTGDAEGMVKMWRF